MAIICFFFSWNLIENLIRNFSDSDDEDEDEDDDDDDEEDSDEEIEAPPAKQAKFDKAAKQNGLPNGIAAKKENDPKQKNQQQQQQQQKNQKQDKQVRT